MSLKYEVHVPAGRWMAGVLHFRTVKEAVAFTDRWNTVEVNSGHSSVCWERVGSVWRERFPAVGSFARAAAI